MLAGLPTLRSFRVTGPKDDRWVAEFVRGEAPRWRDAAAFLSRLYTGDFTSLAPGRCRYAVLLGEDGFIRDDGIVARLSTDRFHVTNLPIINGLQFREK